MVARGWGRGDCGELVVSGHRASVWEHENVLELDGSDGCTKCEST